MSKVFIQANSGVWQIRDTCIVEYSTDPLGFNLNSKERKPWNKATVTSSEVKVAFVVSGCYKPINPQSFEWHNARCRSIKNPFFLQPSNSLFR